MPSFLGLSLGRYDPATSKPSKGWCNEVPFDDDDVEAEWEDDIRQGSMDSISSNQFDNESLASLKIEEASEEAIEDEIEKSQIEEFRTSVKSRTAIVPAPWFRGVPSSTGREIVSVKPVDIKSVMECAVSENNLTTDEAARHSVNNKVADNADKTPEEPALDDEFDDSLIFALTPETCPGPPPSPRPPPRKIPLRIFVATWNMAAEDPFAHRRRGQYIGDDLAAEELRELVPLGYDIYVIGTQEKVTKHLNRAVLARLKQQPVPGAVHSAQNAYRRLVLTSKRRWLRSRSREEECRYLRTYESSDFDSSLGLSSFCGSEIACSMCSPKCTSAYNMNTSFSCDEDVSIPPAPSSAPHRTLDDADDNNSWWSKDHEEKEIRGRGDHAFIRRKSTGLSVYYASHLHGRIEAVAAGSHKFAGSKGGIAVTIRIAGDPQTLTFANCHLEANRIERRRQQLDKLARELPRSLALPKDAARGDVTLATCSDHVVWMGDFNYRIQSLDGDEVLRLLSAGRLQELHDRYDSMADDLEHVPGLQAFHEPAKWPTFYPTYKKVASRARLPLSGSTTGSGRDTHWAQHVYQTSYREPFYKGGRLRERVPGWCDRILYCSRAQSPWGDCLKVEQAACSDSSRGVSSFSPEAVRDNYRSLNDDLRSSDHSPVSCTFLWSVQR
ncbi:unnamed protein product [Phytophthora fragariaefolia]|uniref:Unnamed protein product n=1 Tax=Phytophthora fragariaefolia TaxID=1490495 RepID=A0A9W6WXF3_9STRA|nr:unnamed protein product [Phytophthora fragariaefolia]